MKGVASTGIADVLSVLVLLIEQRLEQRPAASLLSSDDRQTWLLSPPSNTPWRSGSDQVQWWAAPSGIDSSRAARRPMRPPVAGQMVRQLIMAGGDLAGNAARLQEANGGFTIAENYTAATAFGLIDTL